MPRRPNPLVGLLGTFALREANPVPSSSTTRRTSALSASSTNSRRSAASARGPVRPTRDRCWVAWGSAGARRPAPRYFRTRLEAEAFILGLLVGEPGPALVGFDFAFGYPADAGLPAGRALCARLDGLIRDAPDGANNRFEVAGTLNREIQAAFGGGFDGPFWGHPSGHEYADLSPTRPRPFPPRISDGRLVERRLAARRAFRHRLVAIRNSQVRSEARPSNPARPCQAASSVSCRASSASAKDPSIR